MELVLLPLLLLAGLLTTLDGGSDDDTSPGDSLEGTEGDDRTDVTGKTVFFAGGGDDVVQASGNATVYGGAGDDQLLIDEAADDPTSTDPIHLYGGEGNDALISNLGGLASSSFLSGDEGDDFILSHLSGDTLDGGDGNDHLWGRVDSQMTGGAGNDIFDVYVPVRGSVEGEMVITDFNTADDVLGITMLTGHWLETMEITTEVVDGSTRVNFAFDPNAPAFPMGLDNDALDLAAPENFSVLLEGVTEFDPASIRFLNGVGSDTVIEDLETYTVEKGTAGDDVIVNDNFAPTYVFAGAGDDTISSEFRGIILGGDGDDILIHRLIAEPLDIEVTPNTATGADSWSYGGAGNDLIVLQDDFIPANIYDSGVHNIGGFEVGTDQLGLLLPSASAGDASASFGVDPVSGFVTVEVANADETLRIVLHGITQAPPPGFVQLFENEAAVIARTPYATL